MHRRPGTFGKICLGGLTAYAVFLVLKLPATFVDAHLQQATGGIVRLAEAQGTLWSGQGYMEIRDNDQRIGHALPLTWQVRPEALLRGQLGFKFELGHEKQPAPLTLGWSGVELGKTTLTLPAAALGLAVPRLSTLEMRGELVLNITRLAIGRNQVNGQARLDWLRAGSTLTPVYPLGDYRWDIDTVEGVTHVVMRTLQGPLQLDGKGSWQAGTSLDFQGHARVPISLQQRLVPLLRLIAVEQSPGSFAVRVH